MRVLYAPMPISNHVGAPSRSVENLNTFALTVNVVSSSSSPSPSPPWSPGVDRESASSSCDPSVAGVSPLEGASRNPGVDAAAGAAAGVLAVVDAGVDPVVLAPPVPAPVAEADVDVIDDEKPKSGPGAADVDVVVVVVVVADDDDDPWEGDPNEKPMLPAFGGVDPSLLPGATPNPNDAGVVDAAGPPNANGEDFEGKPNGVVGGPPNTLPGCSGGNSPGAWSFFSLSSADFVVAAPNMLLEPPKVPPVVVVVVASPNNFEPGATLKEKGGGADEAGLSFSLSFSSEVDLSEPKSGALFGGLLKSKVLVAPPLPLPPKEKGADSFVARDVAGLSEDGAPVKPENGDDDKVGLESEDAAVVDEKPKGDGCDVDDAGLGVNPVPGAAELVGAAKPAKVIGGTGMAAGADVAGLKRENEGAGTDGLLGGLGALVCVFTWEDLPS